MTNFSPTEGPVRSALDDLRYHARSSGRALTDAVLTGPQHGWTITNGDRSSTELNLHGEQTAGYWADDGATDRR
jgi:hypothetical protein